MSQVPVRRGSSGWVGGPTPGHRGRYSFPAWLGRFRTLLWRAGSPARSSVLDKHLVLVSGHCWCGVYVTIYVKMTNVYREKQKVMSVLSEVHITESIHLNN